MTIAQSPARAARLDLTEHSVYTPPGTASTVDSPHASRFTIYSNYDCRLPSEAFVTEAELKNHLDAAEKSPKQIAAAVLGLPEKTLRYKPSPDKWCILEILGHLADMEILYAYRIRQMLADKDPVIAPIDQDAWAKNLGYLESSPPELIALYGLNRHANVGLLRRLNAEGLQKSARHPELDHRVTVADYVRMMAKHGTNHLEQIERLKRETVGKQ
jgi:hypothetical protein